MSRSEGHKLTMQAADGRSSYRQGVCSGSVALHVSAMKNEARERVAMKLSMLMCSGNRCWGRLHCITCVYDLKRDKPERKLREAHGRVHESGCALETFIGNIFMHWM